MQKSIGDSVKYCHVDPRIDNMILLKECKKAENEGRSSKPKPERKLRTTAATVTPDRTLELTKQLKYQQHQIVTLLGQMKH